MKKFIFISTFFIFAACASEKPKTEAHIKISVLEDVLMQKSKDPADVIKWMKACSKECRSPDKEIAKDLYEGYSILFSVAAKTPRLSQITNDQKQQVNIGQQKIRNSFLKILQVKDGRDILETAYRELANRDSLYTALDTEVKDAVDAAVERLKKNPKTLATSWYLKAISTPQSTENVLDMLADFKKCVDVDNADLTCRASYEELVRFYERPRCQEPNFNLNVKFVAGGDSHKKMIFNGADLLESTLESIGPDHWEIWFTLKTFSAKKLENFTDKIDSKKLLVLTYKGKELAKSSVNRKITDGSFRMIFQNVGLAKEAFDKVCKLANPEKVPDNLKL
jgi:hypothetical protein